LKQNVAILSMMHTYYSYKLLVKGQVINRIHNLWSMITRLYLSNTVRMTYYIIVL